MKDDIHRNHAAEIGCIFLAVDQVSEHLGDVLIGGAILLFFIWRSIRTRRMFLRSLEGFRSREVNTKAGTPSVVGIFSRIFLGDRPVKPLSFFLRAAFYSVVAVLLIPFRDYDITLFWISTSIISAYTAWCIIHGILLILEVEYLT